MSLSVEFRHQEQAEDGEALQERDEADKCAVATFFRTNVKVLQRPAEQCANRNYRRDEKIVEMQREDLGKHYADAELRHVEQLEELEVGWVA